MCPACDSDRFAEIAGAVPLRRCKECGLYLAAFRHTNDAGYDRIDTNAYESSIGIVRRQQSEEIVAFVREHLPSGEWLDVGCGYGYAVEAARAAGYDARGIEPNAVAAKAACDRGVNVTHGMLDEETRAADVLSTLDVLEHVADMNAFAALVRRKARGAWVIKVPSSDGLFFRIAHALRLTRAIERLWQSRYEHPHLVYFDESTLRRFLAKHGFAVRATRYLQEIPTSTVVDRLTLDGATPRWMAWLAVPVVAAINVVERLRGRSDALLVLATPR